jgi:hypothetical protein
MKKTLLATTIMSVILAGCGSDKVEKYIGEENQSPLITLSQTQVDIAESSTLVLDFNVSDSDVNDATPTLEVVSNNELLIVVYDLTAGTLTLSTTEVDADVTAVVTITATDEHGGVGQLLLDVNIFDGEAVVTQGVITGFGSVYVDGVEYETDDAEFTVNDENSDETNFEVGMVVELSGLSRADGLTGKATSIKFSETIRGEIENIDLTNNLLMVMGQSVLLTDETNIKDTMLEDLIVGNIVSISGTLNDEDILVATLLHKKADAKDEIANLVYRLSGEVESLDIESLTFLLGDISIDFTNAEVTGLEDSAVIEEGLFVKVAGIQVVEDSLGGKTLVVDKLKVVKSDVRNIGDKFVFEGFIHEVDFDNNLFVVNRHVISLSEDTQYLLGNLELLSSGIRIGVRAIQTEEEGLVADTILFLHEPNAFLDGVVDDINIDNNTFSIAGITFYVNGRTNFEDESDADVKYFSLDDISIGDYLDVHGFKLTTSDLTDLVKEVLKIQTDGLSDLFLATGIERQNIEIDDETGQPTVDEVELKGKIRILEDGSIAVMEKVLSFNDNSVIYFRDDLITMESLVEKLNQFSESEILTDAQVTGVLDGETLVVSKISFDEHREDFKGYLSKTDSGELKVNGYILEFRSDDYISINDELVSMEQLIQYVGEYLKLGANIKAYFVGVKVGDFFMVDRLNIVETENIEFETYLTLNDEGKLVADNKILIFNDDSKIYTHGEYIDLEQLIEFVKNDLEMSISIRGDLNGEFLTVKKIIISAILEEPVPEYETIGGVFSLGVDNVVLINDRVLSFGDYSSIKIDQSTSNLEELMELLLANPLESFEGTVKVEESLNGDLFVKYLNIYTNITEQGQIVTIDGSLTKNERGEMLIGDTVLTFGDNSVITFGDEVGSVETLLLELGLNTKLRALAEGFETPQGLHVASLSAFVDLTGDLVELSGDILQDEEGNIFLVQEKLLFTPSSEILIAGDPTDLEALKTLLSENASMFAFIVARESDVGLVVERIDVQIVG